MKLGMMASVAVAAGLGLAGPAAAQIIGVDNICEPTGGAVNTVNVKLMSPSLFDYMFKRSSDGQIYNYPATTAAWNRKFALPAGTYKLTFKHPNSTPIGSYAPNILVKDYKIVGGNCLFVSPLDKAQKVLPKSY
jgi:hypothetical protein